MRALLLVMDGVGIGELPDSGDYGDSGSNTLGNLSRAVGGLSLPCLESLGLGNLGDFAGIRKTDKPLASCGVMLEKSRGKDSTAGHWEMMGILTERAFPTYPGGFPPELIGKFERIIGRKTLGNKAASGTAIIEELGDEHMKTGFPIVYTSADSVFQIAAHEEVVSPDELYKMCMEARLMLVPPHNICRVIARPFVGPPFARTPRRKDFSLPPPPGTVLDILAEKGIPVTSVGKVIDLFAHRGFTGSVKVEDNADAMKKTAEAFLASKEGLVFCTLTDFDTKFGHRNDARGFARALTHLDAWLSSFIRKLKKDDCLIITADHGNDPTTESTDHSRERVPVIFYCKKLPPRDLGLREGLWDIGATIAEMFGVEAKKGRSFLP